MHSEEYENLKASEKSRLSPDMIPFDVDMHMISPRGLDDNEESGWIEVCMHPYLGLHIPLAQNLFSVSLRTGLGTQGGKVPEVKERVREVEQKRRCAW